MFRPFYQPADACARALLTATAEVCNNADNTCWWALREELPIKPAHVNAQAIADTGVMLRSQNSIVINRSIADVYQFVAVDFFANYQKWSPEVCELEQLTAGGMRVGVTGRQVRRDHGYRSEAYFRVTQMIPLRYLHFASLSKPDFEVRYIFEPVAGATRLSFDFQLSPPLPMLPFRRLLQYAITQGALRTVTNLQTILQADGEASTTGSTQGTVTS